MTFIKTEWKTLIKTEWNTQKHDNICHIVFRWNGVLRSRRERKFFMNAGKSPLWHGHEKIFNSFGYTLIDAEEKQYKLLRSDLEYTDKDDAGPVPLETYALYAPIYGYPGEWDASWRDTMIKYNNLYMERRQRKMVSPHSCRMVLRRIGYDFET